MLRIRCDDEGTDEERLLRLGLAHLMPSPNIRNVGKLMRQAKPDDVFVFVSVAEIRRLWPSVRKYLGRSATFWSWLLETWEGEERVRR